MANKDYYNYYEILFSLRKEYLKNQELINKLLSYIKVTNVSLDDYGSHLVFKSSHKDNKDSLLLMVCKRQSYLKYILDCFYEFLVYGDYDLERGKFSYAFRLSENYVYLLDDNQDGRHLDSKVDIIDQNKFIELYRKLMENIICKDGSSCVHFDNSYIKLSNNGIYLAYYVDDNYKYGMKLNYDGINDYLLTNNTTFMKLLLKLKIDKNLIPEYFRNLIDSNMDDYSYSVDRKAKDDEYLHNIKGEGRKLVITPIKKY